MRSLAAQHINLQPDTKTTESSVNLDTRTPSRTRITLGARDNRCARANVVPAPTRHPHRPLAKFCFGTAWRACMQFISSSVAGTPNGVLELTGRFEAACMRLPRQFSVNLMLAIRASCRHERKTARLMTLLLLKFDCVHVDRSMVESGRGVYCANPFRRYWGFLFLFLMSCCGMQTAGLLHVVANRTNVCCTTAAHEIRQPTNERLHTTVCKHRRTASTFERLRRVFADVFFFAEFIHPPDVICDALVSADRQLNEHAAGLMRLLTSSQSHGLAACHGPVTRQHVSARVCHARSYQIFKAPCMMHPLFVERPICRTLIIADQANSPCGEFTAMFGLNVILHSGCWSRLNIRASGRRG
jgi:hypothetical protein